MAQPEVREIYEIAVTTTGGKELQQAATALNAANKQLRETTAGAQKFSKSTTDIAKSSGAVTQNFRNLSFQLQDVIVQVSNGTSAFVALGQQLPQMLVGFGAIGAGIGVIAALIPAAAAGVRLLMGDTRDFAEAADDFSDSLNELKTASAASNRSLEELEERFGALAPLVKAANDELAEMARNTALQDAAQALEDLGQGFLHSGSTQRGLVQLSRGLRLTQAETKQLLDILRQVRDAESFAEQAQAAAKLQKAIDDIEASGRVVVPRLEEVRQKAAEIIEPLAEAAVAAGEIGVGLSTSSQAAVELRVNLERAAHELARFREGTASGATSLAVRAAELAALEAGATQEVARLAGEIARARADLADSLGSGEGAMRAAGNQALQERIDLLEAQLAAETRIAAILDERQRVEKAAARAASARPKDDPVATQVLRDVQQQLKARADLLDDASSLLQDFNETLLTDAERAAIKARELSDALALVGDSLSPEDRQRIEAGIRSIGDTSRQMTDEILRLAEDGVGAAFDDIVRGTKTVEAAFKSMLTSIISDIASFLVNQSVQAFFGALSGYLGQTVFAPQATGVPTAPAAPVGPQFAPLRVAAPAPALFTAPLAAAPMLPPPSASAAIAKLSQPNNVYVTVENQAGVDVQVTEGRNATGEAEIDIMITRKMRSVFASGGMDATLRDNFGVRRRTR